MTLRAIKHPSSSAADLISTLADYFTRCPHAVVIAYLFGSQASGRATGLSDIDVAVFVDVEDPEDRAGMYRGILEDLIRVLGTDEVDLSLLNDAYAYEGFGAISEGVLVHCADESRRIALESEIMRRYFEYRDLHSARWRILRRRILNGTMGEGDSSMIDERVVHERLEYIDQMLRLLKSYRGITFEAFARDERTRHAALYELQTCLEAMTDIGNHIIAARALRKPVDRTEVFDILCDAEILPRSVASRVRGAMAMRNVIVHGYLKVVLETVYRTIQEHLGDLEAFCRSIVEYIEKA